MIKKAVNPNELDGHVCDHCLKEVAGSPIQAYFPYGHPADSIDGPSHLCSDKCLIDYVSKLMRKYGHWRSRAVKVKENIRSSEQWRGEKTSRPDNRKSRRFSRKQTQK